MDGGHIVGVWRSLGYLYAGLNIVGGFILIAVGASIMAQPTVNTQSSFGMGAYSSMFNQLGGFAFIYAGLAGIMVGILFIWALVKSGQIESIDKNIKIIAEWAKSQQNTASQITTNKTKDVDSEPDKEIT